MNTFLIKLALVIVVIFPSLAWGNPPKINVLGVPVIWNSIGVRWTQNLEGHDNSNHMRIFTSFKVDKHHKFAAAWNLDKINTPLDISNGYDTLIFQYTFKFD